MKIARHTQALRPLAKPVFIYGCLLAAGTFALTLMDYHAAIRTFSTELYIGLIALFFTVLGIWAGRRLTPKRQSKPFTRNDLAISSLKITRREYEVLEYLAAGKSNKEIARTLGVSPNTIKTQVSSLFCKLGATRRTEAINIARGLMLIS